MLRMIPLRLAFVFVACSLTAQPDVFATLERGREDALFDAGVLCTHRPHWSRQLTEGRRGEFSRRAVDIAPCSAIVLRI